MHLTYDNLGVKLTDTLKVCDGCARSKEKSCAVRNKTHTRVTNTVEMIFVETTGTLSESLIENRYCIGVVDDYRRYSWILLTKTKSQLPKKWNNYLEK